MAALRAAGLASVVANGLLVGASLDQSIKQLPARRRIGPVAYAAYARAADGGNGVAWYATLGVGTAGLTLATGVANARAHPRRGGRTAAITAAALSLAHSFATARAAPIMLSLRRVPDDDALITDRLNRFERWQTVRVFLQAATLAASIAASAAPWQGDQAQTDATRRE